MFLVIPLSTQASGFSPPAPFFCPPERVLTVPAICTSRTRLYVAKTSPRIGYTLKTNLRQLAYLPRHFRPRIAGDILMTNELSAPDPKELSKPEIRADRALTAMLDKLRAGLPSS